MVNRVHNKRKLDIIDSIRSEIRINKKGHSIRVYIFKCLLCNNELFKTKGDCKFTTGLCLSCISKHIHCKEDQLHITEKICSKCNVILPIKNFNLLPKNNKRFTNICVYCLRLNKFNLTYKNYLDLYNKQNGKCKICDIEILKSDLERKVLNVDHCHKTKKIRGLLCMECNTGIGLFGENVEIIKNAIEYLKNDR